MPRTQDPAEGMKLGTISELQINQHWLLLTATASIGHWRSSDPHGMINIGVTTKTHRTVRSSEPDTTILASELMATLFTLSVCPWSMSLHAPDFRSQILRWKHQWFRSH